MFLFIISVPTLPSQVAEDRAAVTEHHIGELVPRVSRACVCACMCGWAGCVLISFSVIGSHVWLAVTSVA